MAKPYESKRRYGTWASRFMDTVGDGSGSIDAVVDGSSTPVDFHYLVPAGKVALVDRLIIWVKDSGGFDVANYGNGVVLTNGMLDGVTDPAGVFQHSGDLAVKTNGDWASLCYDVTYHSFGQGDNILVARYSFFKDGSSIMVPAGYKFTIRIQDALAGLTGHRFRLGATICPS